MVIYNIPEFKDTFQLRLALSFLLQKIMFVLNETLDIYCYVIGVLNVSANDEVAAYKFSIYCI